LAFQMADSTPQHALAVRLRAQRLAARDVCGDSPSCVSGSDVLAALRHVAQGEFPRQSRPTVQPLNVKQVPGLSLGLVSGMGTGQRVCLSRGSQLLPGLTRLLCRFMRQQDPDFNFTSIQVNYGFASREHVDQNNLGPSWIHALGGFQGGELWVEDASSGSEEHICSLDILTANGAIAYERGSRYRGRTLDVKHRWQHFDGRRLHFTKPIRGGERFSVIFYAMNRHSHATASERRSAEELGFPLPELALHATVDAVERLAPTTACLPTSRSWTCRSCGQVFPSSSRLHRHAKMHGPCLHVCGHPGCGRSFRRKEQLRRHEGMHIGTRPHRCELPGCGKSFADAYGLKRHMRRHGTSEAPV